MVAALGGEIGYRLDYGCSDSGEEDNISSPSQMRGTASRLTQIQNSLQSSLSVNALIQTSDPLLRQILLRSGCLAQQGTWYLRQVFLEAEQGS